MNSHVTKLYNRIATSIRYKTIEQKITDMIDTGGGNTRIIHSSGIDRAIKFELESIILNDSELPDEH